MTIKKSCKCGFSAEGLTEKQVDRFLRLHDCKNFSLKNKDGGLGKNAKISNNS